MSDIETYDSLYDILKLRQLEPNYDNKYQGIYIYLYDYVGVAGKLDTIYKTFNSINELSKYLGVARETLSIYLNTYVPFSAKCEVRSLNLFLTKNIESFELVPRGRGTCFLALGNKFPQRGKLVEKLISDATQGLKLYTNLAKKV